jgi:hypothetical protein
MADTPLGSMETPEDVLESEIRELEKRDRLARGFA